MGGVDSNGRDVVRALCLDFTGRPVRWGVRRECRKWMVEAERFDDVRAIRSAWKAYAYGVDVLSTQDRRGSIVRSGRFRAIRRDVLGFLCEGRS